METKQPFKILSKICLNNWHYIDQKILTFSEGINFFTGHSGSGKSTVIDAMQIVLYANTDGRGFFNKAAADDSDRSLIEYLRGMVNINEHNEFQYLRNQNFSSTIVLEKLRFLKYCDSLFSLIFTIPLKYSISVRSESSAAALLKNPRPSVLAYSTIWIASRTVDLPLPECPVKKLIPSLSVSIFLSM